MSALENSVTATEATKIPQPLSLEEATKFFRVCDKTIRGWIKKGLLKRVPGISKVFVTHESAQALANGIHVGQ